MKKTSRIQRAKIKTVSLHTRKSKFSVADCSRVPAPQGSFADFLESLPNVLAAQQLKQVVTAMQTARRNKKKILLMMGAHVIKCGLSPLIIDLMARGYLSAIAFNGAGAIHDFELAFCGKTSEEVDTAIQDGSFGMSRETAEFFSRIIRTAREKKQGLGQTAGERILRDKLPYASYSILAAGVRCNIPVTVHVAIGTDIFHPHPECDGADLGAATMNDFYRFIESVSGLSDGVVLNVGSAVILPEVFLKALSTARNLKKNADNFTAVCFDMIRHYRPFQNVVRRPTATGGSGHYIIGHHEIMIPLLHRMLIEGEQS